jgi:hypothetical protein
VEEGNLLDQQHFVVPIKTGGRAYGRISQQFVRRFNFQLPELGFREAEFAVLDERNHRTVTFVAYWDEEMSYTVDHVAIAAGRAMRTFTLESIRLSTTWGVPDPWLLSMPLFKGAEKSVEHVAAMEDELSHVYATLANIGMVPCEVEIVVPDRARVPSYE